MRLFKVVGIPILSLTAAYPVQAKFTTPNCPDFQTSEFRYVRVVSKTADSDPTLAGPVKLDFDRQADGKVDIWFVERAGKVKVWKAATGQAFFKLTRYTATNGVLNMQGGKDILVIPNGMRVSKHTGGAMDFDAYHDLWLTIGNNSPDQPALVHETDWESSAEASSSNSSDLRGSVLRIHPDDSPKGYGIPPGKFGDYWSKQFASQGKASLSAEYADPAKVLPEIYVKGTRSPYSLTLDPYRRTEEHNLVTHPVFAGYPYFAGNQTAVLREPYLTQAGGPKSAAAPMNDSKWNKGPKQLPPAEPGLDTYFSHGGTTGPIYRYDGDLQSAVKFPPHFDKAWFVTDYAWTGATAFELDEAGARILDSVNLFNNFGFAQPLDFKQGPDGALYTFNYGGAHPGTASTHIGRIEYTGSCRPAFPKLPLVPTALRGPSRWNGATPAIHVTSTGLVISAQGDIEIEIRTLEGRKVMGSRAHGRAQLAKERLPSGLHALEIRRGAARYSAKVVLP